MNEVKTQKVAVIGFYYHVGCCWDLLAAGNIVIWIISADSSGKSLLQLPTRWSGGERRG